MLRDGFDVADPRLFIPPPPATTSVLPVVAKPRQGLPAWALGVGIVAAGALLFSVLDGRRRAAEVPAVKVRAIEQVGAGAATPPLYVPPEPIVAPRQPAISLPVQQTTAPPARMPASQPQIVYVPQPVPTPVPVEVSAPPARVSAEPALLLDTGSGSPPSAAGPSGAAGAEAAAAPDGSGTAQSARVRAGMLANRATTVGQGTLIPAVLETALDSTRPGFARAIVSRDVRSFDGSRVLIPRGSRLIGEYRADVARGQRRAMVNWTRLIRPDGVTIGINSPATDTLGGGGIRARVNSHFIERFAGALLQSVLAIGSSFAGRLGSDSGSIVVLPGAVQGATQVVQPSQITPTLTVRQGTSISVFVARDLDFTSAGTRR